jgi:polysaccharide deacetylase 2 family uncharacterized protein YibQ
MVRCTDQTRSNDGKKAKKKIKRRPWSKEDMRELKSLARQKVSAVIIAKQFKRSLPALRQKAMNLGISLDSRARRKRKA